MVSPEGVTPRERLATARLYLVCPARPRGLARGGRARRGRHRAAARQVARRRRARRRRHGEFRGHGALFILNDRPDLVEACGADGVHVGQDDATPGGRRARPSARTGSSAAPRTRRPRRRPRDADPDVDYLAVGPVHATPTKPGRPAAGLDYVAHAARRRSASRGSRSAGSTRATCDEVAARGATRIVVVRAITERGRPGGGGPRAAGRAGGPRWRRLTAVRPLARAERRRAASAPLEPLGAGERPLGIKLAVALALVVAVANLVGAAAARADEQPVAGARVRRVMLAAAAGMWARRYLVVLAFEALLGRRSSSTPRSRSRSPPTCAARARASPVIASARPMFWLLIRVMARLQVPRE